MLVRLKRSGTVSGPAGTEYPVFSSTSAGGCDTAPSPTSPPGFFLYTKDNTSATRENAMLAMKNVAQLSCIERNILSSINLDQWHCVLFQYIILPASPGGAVRLWVDAVASPLRLFSSAVVQPDSPQPFVRLGSATSSNDTGAAEGIFAGLIDRFAVWDSTDSEDHVRGKMRRCASANFTMSPGAIAFFLFNETGGNIAADLSPSGLNGTLVGNVSFTSDGWVPQSTLMSATSAATGASSEKQPSTTSASARSTTTDPSAVVGASGSSRLDTAVTAASAAVSDSALASSSGEQQQRSSSASPSSVLIIIIVAAAVVVVAVICIVAGLAVVGVAIKMKRERAGESTGGPGRAAGKPFSDDDDDDNNNNNDDDDESAKSDLSDTPYAEAVEMGRVGSGEGDYQNLEDFVGAGTGGVGPADPYHNLGPHLFSGG